MPPNNPSRRKIESGVDIIESARSILGSRSNHYPPLLFSLLRAAQSPFAGDLFAEQRCEKSRETSAWKPVHKNRNGNDDVRRELRKKEGEETGEESFLFRDISDLLMYQQDLRLFPASSF